MKKLLMGLIVTGLTCTLNQAKAQVEKGNVIVDLYYGGPNFGKKLANGLEVNGEPVLSTVDIGGIGPLGFRAEYMLADKIGLGVDFIFNSTTLSFDADSTRTDGSIYDTYAVKSSMRRIRVQARFNYHFVQTDNLDAYFGVGAGSNTRVWSVKTDFPNYTDSNSGTLLPVSMRVCVGLRYYFTQNIGVSGEIGLGGPVLSAGLSLKF